MTKTNYAIILRISNDITLNDRIVPTHKTWLNFYGINKKALLSEKAKYINNLENCKYKIYDYIVNQLNK